MRGRRGKTAEVATFSLIVAFVLAAYLMPPGFTLKGYVYINSFLSGKFGMHLSFKQISNVGHIMAFAILTPAAAVSLGGQRPWKTVFGVLLSAYAIEALQSLVPLRTSSFSDLRMNLAGVAIGVVILAVGRALVRHATRRSEAGHVSEDV